MPFIAYIDDKNTSFDKRTKLLLPISIMGQKNHTGERLKALVDLAKNHNSTILIADTLHRHNLKDGEKEALAIGDKFLERHRKLFEGTVLIESAEDWEKYKNDETAVKLIRWSTWGKIKSSEFKEASDLIEGACRESNSSLIKKLNETAQNSVSKSSVSSSIAYQKEENAYLLTFSEFDYHCYPGPLNSSQAETVKLFNQQYKIPVHKSIKFESVQLSEEDAKHKEKRHEKSLPFPLRLMIENFEKVLASTEISPAHKELFRLQITNILTSTKHEYEINNKHCESATFSTTIVGELPLSNKSTDLCSTGVNGLTFFPTAQSPKLSRKPTDLCSMGANGTFSPISQSPIPRTSELLSCSAGQPRPTPYPTGVNKLLSYSPSQSSESTLSKPTERPSFPTYQPEVTCELIDFKLVN